MITSEYNSFCTGVDFNQQWMLPWWLSNMYEHHTEEKITICDFGMSESWAEFAKKNCDEYIKFPTRKEMAWFYKPLALAKTKGNKTETASLVGKKLAEKAVSKGIKQVSFDRSGYLYHGRVKSLADGAREGGLKF